MSGIAQATFWGAILIFLSGVFYYWVLAPKPSFWIGLLLLGFVVFIAWLGIKLSGN